MAQFVIHDLHSGDACVNNEKERERNEAKSTLTTCSDNDGHDSDNTANFTGQRVLIAPPFHVRDRIYVRDTEDEEHASKHEMDDE
jgi:hypothetical protein